MCAGTTSGASSGFPDRPTCRTTTCPSGCPTSTGRSLWPSSARAASEARWPSGCFSAAGSPTSSTSLRLEWGCGRGSATRSRAASRRCPHERAAVVGAGDGGGARVGGCGGDRRARAAGVGGRPHQRGRVDSLRRAGGTRRRAAGRHAGRPHLPQRSAKRLRGGGVPLRGRRRRQHGGRDESPGGGGPADRAGGRLGAVSIRIGTCSWADESLSKLWYPPSVRSAEDRLRYYAERFDTVEVNSSYYALPTAAMATAWADRTPPGFVFHVKAFGMMTRHPVKVEQLPPEMRSEVAVDERGRVDRPSRELRAEVFRRFLREITPLRDAGKLGGILMQLPQYITYRPQSLEYLEWAAEQLAGEQMLVEFRHRSWLDEEVRGDVLGFLHDLGATYVIVDAPRSGAANVAPTVVAATSDTAYLRLHGRNQATWNKRGGSAAERFDHLYSEEELREWVGPLAELSGQAENVYAMFNNNGRSTMPGLPTLENPAEEGTEVAQAPVNAEMLRQLLQREGLPVTPAPAAA